MLIPTLDNVGRTSFNDNCFFFLLQNEDSQENIHGGNYVPSFQKRGLSAFHQKDVHFYFMDGEGILGNFGTNCQNCKQPSQIKTDDCNRNAVLISPHCLVNLLSEKNF